MWDDQEGFYYDIIHCPDGQHIPLKIRSFVGLIPLYAVETLEPDLLEVLPRFKRRMDWFIEHRPYLMKNIASLTEPGSRGRRLLSLVNPEQLKQIMAHLLDEGKFLSDYGLRALSKEHDANPFTFTVGGQTHTVSYEPGESTSGMFGGNSNWRGPIWFPINYLMIESLQKFHHYHGSDLQVEFPTGSGQLTTLDDVAAKLTGRLIKIFMRDENDRRSFYGDTHIFQTDPFWQNHILFFEYFHGETGKGLGASHQTGWTALVANLIQGHRPDHSYQMEP